VDGNGTEAQNEGCPDPAFLCFPDLMGNLTNLTTTNGQPVPASGPLAAPNVLGEIDRTWTTTNSYGGSFQATTPDRVSGLTNPLVVGPGGARAHVQFTTPSGLGTVNADQSPFVKGVGVIIDPPWGALAPVSLLADPPYRGVYATDTFDIPSRL